MNTTPILKNLAPVERLSNSLRTISEEARDMLEGAGSDAAAYGQQVRERLASLAEYASETSQQLERHVRKNARAANGLVHNHPYESVGIAFGIGLLIGLLGSRRY